MFNFFTNYRKKLLKIFCFDNHAIIITSKTKLSTRFNFTAEYTNFTLQINLITSFEVFYAYCFQFQILLSNDVNLRNKALINNIAAYGPKDITNKVQDFSQNMKNQQKIYEINLLLSNMCTEIILTEMREAYGSVLYKLITEPPWDLKQCLLYIKRFWSPVFSLVITQKQCLKIIEDLLTFIQTNNGTELMA